MELTKYKTPILAIESDQAAASGGLIDVYKAADVEAQIQQQAAKLADVERERDEAVKKWGDWMVRATDERLEKQSAQQRVTELEERLQAYRIVQMEQQLADAKATIQKQQHALETTGQGYTELRDRYDTFWRQAHEQQAAIQRLTEEVDTAKQIAGMWETETRKARTEAHDLKGALMELQDKCEQALAYWRWLEQQLEVAS